MKSSKMLLYFLVLNVLFIPLYGVNVSVTLEQSSESSKVTSISTTKPETKLTLLTEGGKVVTELPARSLAKEKSTMLLTLDEELGNTKDKKPVKARKGVLPDSNKVDKHLKILPHLDPANETDTNITKLIPSDKLHTNRTVTEPNANNPTSVSGNVILSNKNKTVGTEHVKKPRILVYDDLASEKINEHPLHELQSSSKPVSDQIQSSNSKLHLKSKGAEPGMLMPVVITMVVVPAFALLAYMAVKRGKEAWKNRHYKRMDFLLDGMYND